MRYAGGQCPGAYASSIREVAICSSTWSGCSRRLPVNRLSNAGAISLSAGFRMSNGSRNNRQSKVVCGAANYLVKLPRSIAWEPLQRLRTMAPSRDHWIRQLVEEYDKNS